MSTAIQWTNETWNPIAAYDSETGKRGWFCVHASTGCLHCYAEDFNRFRGNGHAYRVGEINNVDIQLVDHVLLQPFHWRKPRRVFPCSMTDLFLDAHSDEMLDVVFAVMALTPQHTYQVLTKRAARMREYFARRDRKRMIAAAAAEVSQRRAVAAGSVEGRISLDHFQQCFAAPGPFPNVWLGTTVENDKVAHERIGALLRTPAAIRFLSCEPLLGTLDLSPYLDRCEFSHDDGEASVFRSSLAWVIVGGESGKNARPFDLAWARSIVHQCRAAGVAPFVKQLGARPACANDEHSELWPGATPPFAEDYEPQYQGEIAPLTLSDSHGGDWDEWPADLRVREFPTVRA